MVGVDCCEVVEVQSEDTVGPEVVLDQILGYNHEEIKAQLRRIKVLTLLMGLGQRVLVNPVESVEHALQSNLHCEKED